MREQVPLESDKEYGYEGRKDEEALNGETLTKETNKIAAKESIALR
jgi:hypothetical protein